MKLFKEEVLEIDLLKEQREDGKKDYFLKGIIMEAEIVNKNNRMYPLDVLEQEVNRYNKEYVAKNRALGELGHPDKPTINLDRASHRFVEIHKEGNQFHGKALIMDTPMGSIVKNLMDAGTKLGMSSRAMGSLKPNDKGVMIVQPDLHLSTAGDIVADPSAPNAFVEGVMEGVEWILEAGSWTPKFIDQAQRAINNASASVDRTKLEETAMRVWAKFLQNIK
jgi:hypothetical protein